MTAEPVRMLVDVTPRPPMAAMLDERPGSSLDEFVESEGDEYREPDDEPTPEAIDAEMPAVYRVGGKFEVTPKGVEQVVRDTEGKEHRTWICSRLDLIARTRTQDGDGWGVLLHWKDADGRPHEWAMPRSLLAGDGGADVFRTLLDRGLRISPKKKARTLLLEYLAIAPTASAWCSKRIGWHGCSFILPDETIGAGDERAVYQPAEANSHAYRVAGTLEEWQQTTGRWCAGNSRLAFAVSVALAAPLLALVEEEGGGFHYRGASSSGKTTALQSAASVWGGGTRPPYMQRWRATSNGLEAVAELHNDALLVLDEIGQVDPREAGETAYLLANGAGKARANRTGGARDKRTWRLLFLSAGEISLRDHMASAGKRTRAGQDLRMADIGMDAGAGLGGFEDIHGHESPDAFARALKDAAARYYGTAARAFLAQLVTKDPHAVAEQVTAYRKHFIAEHVPAGASGEVFRLAGRFALVAAAGEAAISAEILPWPKGEAGRAAGTCFRAWLDGRGSHGAGDMEAAIAQVRAFIEAHGSSRFEPLGDNAGDRPPVTYERAGYRQRDGITGEIDYLVLTEAFRQQVCAGFDPAATARELAARGYLKRGEDDRLQDKVRVSGVGRVRVYRIAASILEG